MATETKQMTHHDLPAPSKDAGSEEHLNYSNMLSTL